MSRPGSCPYPATRRQVHIAALTVWLWMGVAATLAAANVAPDYPLVEKPIAQEIAVAPLIVEATVLAPGSFQAMVEIETVYKNTLPDGGEPPRCLRVTGFNSIAGDRASRALRAGDRAIFFLQPAGDLYFTPRVGGGRFVIEAATEFGEAKVVASLGDPLLLVPLDPEHFRTMIRAIVAAQALAADDDTPPEADRTAAAKTRRADSQRAVDAGIALAKASLSSSNPARQYFGLVLARALAALELTDELTELCDNDNARLQADSLEALTGLIRHFGFDHPRLDRAALLRSARAGLRSKSLRTRLAAAQALAQMPADGVARELMTFYRDATAEYFALKNTDEKRRQFADQRSRFWLSPAMLKDPAAEAILLDFAASNDLNTATGALAVLGLRGQANCIPALVELHSEKDFKYGEDARVALFRIALSDEVLKSSGDWKAWVAAAEKQTPAQRLKAGLQRVDHLLATPGDAPDATDNRHRGLLLASCLPGELSLPRLIEQTAVPPGDLSALMFARTQSPLAFPYLARALLVGSDGDQIQAEIALRGWAQLEPLVAFGCDSEIGMLAADQTRFGDNPGLDAAAELLGPDTTYGLVAGMTLDNTIRYRGRRMQLLQAYHGQSFGWGEYELEWNATLCQWATLRLLHESRGRRPIPPALREWLAGERERQAEDRTAEAIVRWARGLSADDPLLARAHWRQLRIAGEPLSDPAATDPTNSQRSQVLAAAWNQIHAESLQGRLLSINLLGQLRAPFDRRLLPLLQPATPLAVRHQAWYALGRMILPDNALTEPEHLQLLAQIGELARTGSDPFERVLAVWTLRTLPEADGLLADLLLADPAGPAPLPPPLRRTVAAAMLYRAACAPSATLPAVLGPLTAALPDSNEFVQRRLWAALGVCRGDPTPAVRALRIRALTRALDSATRDTYDIPSDLMRAELNPQPYMTAETYRLNPTLSQLLSQGLQTAWTASADDPEVTLSDNAERAFGWAYATGAWPGRLFNEIQLQAIQPLGKWPQRRARTVTYALEGLARSEAAVSASRLRILMQSDDDRLAGYAGLMLARLNQPDDLLDIFNRFNNATPKSATWFNTIGTTGSADGLKFLTETMTTTGHEAWLATWALGYCDTAGARTKLTQTGIDPRAGNSNAAIFGWTRQLQKKQELAGSLSKSTVAEQLLLCDAVEWLPPDSAASAAIRAAIFALLKADAPAVYLRADLTLTRLTGHPGCRGAAARPTSQECISHWEPILYPKAPK